MSQMWSKADEKNPTASLLPEEYGWIRTEQGYTANWYDGPVLPSELEHHEKYNRMEIPEGDVWSGDSDDEDSDDNEYNESIFVKRK